MSGQEEISLSKMRIAQIELLVQRLNRVSKKIAVLSAPYEELKEDITFLQNSIVTTIKGLQDELVESERRTEDLNKENTRLKKEVEDLRKKISPKQEEKQEEGGEGGDKD